MDEKPENNPTPPDLQKGPTHSPAVKKKPDDILPLMSFPEALKLLIAGEMITKKEWGNQNIYGVLKDGFLMLHKDDGKFYRWMVGDGDLLGEDWYVRKAN